MEKSRIEKMEGDSVVLRLSRAVDARVLALLTKLLEAVDKEEDDLYISRPEKPVEQKPYPWPDTIPCPSPYPPGIVVCYGCGPVTYNPRDYTGTTEIHISGTTTTVANKQ